MTMNQVKPRYLYESLLNILPLDQFPMPVLLLTNTNPVSVGHGFEALKNSDGSVTHIDLSGMLTRLRNLL